MNRFTFTVAALLALSFGHAQSVTWEYARLDWNTELEIYYVAFPDEELLGQTPEDIYEQITGEAPEEEGSTGSFDMLNAFGSQGWELVSSVEDVGSTYQYTFKRPTQE